MAELADALDSGSNRGNSVEVQVLLSAPRKTSTQCVLVFLFRCGRGLEQGGGAQRSELDYLIYNDPLAYAELILNGEPEEYLRNVAGSHGLED